MEEEIYKKCICCGNSYSIEYYLINKNKRVSKTCKPCRNIKRREKRNKNINAYREYSKKYNRTHKDKIKEYVIKTEDSLKRYRKEYYQKNIEKIRENHKKYFEENKEKIAKSKAIYEKTRIENDSCFSLKKRIRISIRNCFKKYSKKGKLLSCNVYGIDFDSIFIKLGPRPTKNHVLDHIIPISIFNFDDPIHVRLSHCPENLQWITEEENNIKSDIIYWDIISSDLTLLAIAHSLGLSIEHDGSRARDIKIYK